MTHLLEWLADDSGDDLLEYALLTGLVALASAAALSLFPDVMKRVYESWDSATQNRWEPLPPQ